MAELKICLRAGEKIYINGAVIRASGKITFSILNDATFLLESHILQAEEATTPFKQLYFIIQTMLMSPKEAETVREVFEDHCAKLQRMIESEVLRAGLAEAKSLIDRNKPFVALKVVRNLFAAEEDILGSKHATAA